MKKRFLGVVVLVIWSAVLPAPVRAHHGDAGRYIADVTTLTGTVAQFVMVNPHAFIVLDIIENGTTTRWTAELNGPQGMEKSFG
ncbi:MAG: hypothetical protein HY824_03415, partial [Acidobacteria bacterium]|nr:hypothetical protein [Acidobacteriota bacterium]